MGERKWNCREVARQLVEIQKAMSTSLLTLVKKLEDDVEVGITPERIPVIRDKYASLSRRVQELATLSEPPIVDTISRVTSSAALSWASDYFTNMRNVIDNDSENTNIDSASVLNTFANGGLYTTYPERKEKKEDDRRGFKGWWKKKFRNGSEETRSVTINSKKKRQYQQITSINNTFREKLNHINPKIPTPLVESCKDNTKSLPKLCVFDGNHMPLTDLHGNVLKNVFGQPLVVFDIKGKPLDRLGAPVYDSRGLPSSDQGFTPVENHTITKLSPISLFDSKGYPLTGKDGHVLLDPTGEALVRFCRPGADGLVYSDKHGKGVWDTKGVPLCPIQDKWLDQESRPYRFFTNDGMPVTDCKGRVLNNIHDAPLLIRDTYGRPHNVQDTFGVPISAYAFDGTLHPPNEGENFCIIQGNPMRLYNSKGFPLTDQDGRILFDSFGNALVRVDYHHNPLKDDDGTKIFDGKKFPLFCNPAEPIANMDGKPMLFYDKNKRPLTDRRGVPLVLASGILLIKFDEVGRPFTDQKGKPLCDFDGNGIQDKNFDATICPIVNPAQLQITYGGKPGFTVYDKTGRPLTDFEGNALVNSDGTSLEFNVVKQKKKTLKQEYDNFGRPIYDKFNRNLYCHGKPIFDIFGQKVFNLEHEENSTGYFRNGEFNRFGIPTKDKYLRDLFDENGTPLCDNGGLPESKEVHNADGILLSVNDSNQIIKLPIYRGKILEGLCLQVDGMLIGIPKEFSILPEEWVISNVQNDDDPLPEDEDYKYFTAIIRRSNLSTLNSIQEVLALFTSKT